MKIVLIVSTNKELVAPLNNYLDWSTIIANTGKIALSALANQPEINGILFEPSLSDISIVDFVKEVNTYNVPLFLIAEDNQDNINEEIKNKIDITGILYKPFSPTQLDMRLNAINTIKTNILNQSS